MNHPNRDSEALDAVVRLLSITGRLKTLRRQGWIDRGVDDPESVSDHSFRLALLTLVLARPLPDLDTDRAVRIALVHDLPEAIAGDVTPFDEHLAGAEHDRTDLFRTAPSYSDSADRRKTDAERQALIEMTGELPDDLRDMLVDAWEEYEAGETPEARLVRQLDKLETWLQALEYRSEQPDLVIESFRLGTERDVTDPALRRLLAAINRYFDDDEQR